MAPSSPANANRIQPARSLRAFGPPFWRDVMFWIALALSLVLGAIVGIVLLMLLGMPRNDAGWAWTIGLALVGAWIGFVIFSMGLNSARGMKRGASEADPERGDRLEARGRKAGKFVGTGIAKVTGRSKAEVAQAPGDSSPTTTDDSPQPTIDDAARSLGMMIGRRISARKGKS
ncbi:MAG: hypothetical protein WEA11_01075 [Acidimicrobiales bacterium]